MLAWACHGWGKGLLQRCVPALLAALCGLAPAKGLGDAPQRWTDHPYPPRFEHITRLQGLARNNVLALLQDRRGFFWIGTEDGLERYDGRTFKLLRHDPETPGSLSSSWVSSLLEDRDGNIWAGTNGGGLNRIDGQTGAVLCFRKDDHVGSLASDQVTATLMDPEGNLWVGTQGGGLNLLPSKAGLQAHGFVHFGGERGAGAPAPGSVITSLCLDAKGQVWVGNARGRLSVGTRDPGPKGWRFTPVDPEGAPPRLGVIFAICQDPRGCLWLGTSSGLYRLDPTGQRVRKISLAKEDTIVRRLYCDPHGVVWVGSEGHGLDKVVVAPGFDAPATVVHHHHQSNDPSSISSNDVECIYEDRAGMLWVGTYADGLNKLALSHHDPLEREKPPMHLFVPGHPSLRERGASVVGAFLEDHWGNLWIGTDGQGLDLVRPPARTEEALHFEHFVAGQRGLKESVVISLFEDRKGRLWAGTYQEGLVRIHFNGTGNPTFEHFKSPLGAKEGFQSNFVVSLLDDAQGQLWVGTVVGGLHRFNPETRKAVRVPLVEDLQKMPESECVYALAEDRHHTLWVGTDRGLFRLNPATQAFESYTAGKEGHLSHSDIRSLCVDRQGTLWVGTHGGGLNRAEVGPFGTPVRFRAFTTRQGIQDGALLGVVEDQSGILWISGPQGLVRFDPREGRGRLVTQKGQPPETEYSRNAFLKTRSGELLFGGRNGFVVFHPEDVRENRTPPGVAITDFRIGHKSVGVGQQVGGRTLLTRTIEATPEITLSHREQVLTFQFAALHFVDPATNQFAAMLEGLDKDWHHLGTQDNITYTTLPAGQYALRVKAANSDGVWHSEGVRLRLIVLPPFYRTTWFITLCLLVAAGMIWGYVKRKLYLSAQREHELRILVEERTTQLQEANEELERQATTDAMTGLANYRYFQMVYRISWAQASREKENISLVMLDIDYFKRYNDSLGHQAGDDCLRKVGAALKGCARRAGDVIARYGGEEFVVLLQGTDDDGATLMMERLRKAVEDLALPHPDSPVSPYVTASLGCAVVVPGKHSSLDELIERADQALYRAKANGRNQGCKG